MTGNKKKLRQQRNLPLVFEFCGSLWRPCHVALSLSLEAHNKQVSGSLRCTRSTQISSLRSQTSDTCQTLYAKTFGIKVKDA